MYSGCIPVYSSKPSIANSIYPQHRRHNYDREISLPRDCLQTGSRAGFCNLRTSDRVVPLAYDGLKSYLRLATNMAKMRGVGHGRGDINCCINTGR